MATKKTSLARNTLNPPLRVLIELLARIALEEIIAQRSDSASGSLEQKAA